MLPFLDQVGWVYVDEIEVVLCLHHPHHPRHLCFLRPQHCECEDPEAEVAQLLGVVLHSVVCRHDSSFDDHQEHLFHCLIVYQHEDHVEQLLHLLREMLHQCLQAT